LLVCVTFLIAPGLRAQEPTAPPSAAATPSASSPSWGFQGKLALAEVRGNSDTSNLAAQLAYSFNATRWDLAADASALWAEQSGSTVAEAYQAGLLARRRFDARRGLVFTEQWRRAPPEGIDFRNLLGVGVDLRVVDREPWQLLTELGLAWQHEEPVAGESSDLAVGVLVLASRERISSTTTATQKVTGYFEDVHRRRYESRADLQAKLTRRLALEVSYELRYDNDPVPGARRTDTVLNTSLILSLGSPSPGPQ
jgi:putative salt-induced outer membrane protein YdiY